MIYNKKDVKLQLSENELKVLLELAAMMDMSVGELVSAFAHDMVYAWSCNTEDPRTKIVGHWFNVVLEGDKEYSSFIPWLSSGENLGLMLLHLESVFKSLHRICCSVQVDYITPSKVLMRAYESLLDRFADFELETDDIQLDCLSNCPKEISWNIKEHFRAIRAIDLEYLEDSHEQADFQHDMIRLVLWWKNIYLGE